MEKFDNDISVDRKVTDVFFLALHVLVLLAGAAFIGYGAVKGNFDPILRVKYSSGKYCGIGEAEAYPLAYFHNLQNNSEGVVCVANCPKEIKVGNTFGCLSSSTNGICAISSVQNKDDTSTSPPTVSASAIIGYRTGFVVAGICVQDTSYYTGAIRKLISDTY